MTRRGGLLISCTDDDAQWRAEITATLPPSVRTEGIDAWDEARIAATAQWREAIGKAMESAQVALLLVSPSFLASPFIAGREMASLFRNAHDDGLNVVWVLVSDCAWKQTVVAEFQAANVLAEPLDTLPRPRREEELLTIAEKVTAAMREPRFEPEPPGVDRSARIRSINPPASRRKLK